jgi:hypothetical protein
MSNQGNQIRYLQWQVWARSETIARFTGPESCCHHPYMDVTHATQNGNNMEQEYRIIISEHSLILQVRLDE